MRVLLILFAVMQMSCDPEPILEGTIEKLQPYQELLNEYEGECVRVFSYLDTSNGQHVKEIDSSGTHAMQIINIETSVELDEHYDMTLHYPDAMDTVVYQIYVDWMDRDTIIGNLYNNSMTVVNRMFLYKTEGTFKTSFSSSNNGLFGTRSDCLYRIKD